MRDNLYKNHFQKIFGFILCLSILSGSFSIGSAQTNFKVNQTFGDRDKNYALLLRQGRGSDFAQLLTKTVGVTDVEGVQNWLDENNAGFFRRFDTAFQKEAERYFERKNNKSSDAEIVPKTTAPKSTLPAKRKPSVRRSAFDSSSNVFFQNASYNPASGNLLNQSAEKSFVEASEDDDIVIKKTETDDGFQVEGAVEKSKILGDVVLTQSGTTATRLIKVEGGNIGEESTTVQTGEAVNKKERRSLRTEVTTSWRYLLASCPDADGISAGTATMTLSTKVTLTTPQTIGIMTRDVTTRMKIKGVVNDAAEFTHFDLEGSSAETISGYDRAERIGLVESVDYADGAKQVNWTMPNNKLGTRVKDDTGFTKHIEGERGELKVFDTPGTSEADALRFAKIFGLHLWFIYEQASTYYERAQDGWRNGDCVEIALTAPKTKLRPAEQIEVAAETVHKYDKSKVNAELILESATDSATPEKQSGTPQGKFNLTAPPKGKTAWILVKSVSRRGIASESLDFEEEKPIPKRKTIPPKQTPIVKKCGAWSGTITAVKTKKEESTRPPDGRLLRLFERDEETFNITYSLAGVQDRTQGFANAYFSSAQTEYRRVEYREHNYAAGKTSCGNQIITTPRTQKFESIETALLSKRITVYITSTGEKGILTFDSPEINAERIVTRKQESNCASSDRVNSSVERADSLIGVPSPGFEIEFELDANSETQLNGSQTIENSDGSQTIVSWNLSRDCK